MGTLGSRPLVTARVMRAFLLEQLDQPLLLRHQRIDPRRLPVKERRNGPLLGFGCERNPKCPKDGPIQIAETRCCG